jgi:exosortase
MNNTNPATNRRGKWLLGLLLILAGLTYRQLVIGDSAQHFLPTIVGSFFSVSGTPVQFFYVLVIGLFYIRRKDIARAFHGDGVLWSAMYFLVPGICLLLWGLYVDVTDIIYVSFLLVVVGSARYLSGKSLARTILLPVLILVVVTPMPAVLINQIIFPLQLWDAEHTSWLLNVIGVPSQVKGDIISTARGDFFVAESCTALGFIKWLIVFALTYVYLFPVPRLHAALLILSAPVIAYAVNILRVSTLVLNPGMDVLSIHTLQGIVFFMIGFSLLYVVDNLLARFTGKAGETYGQQCIDNCIDAEPGQKNKRIQILIAVFSLLCLASVALPRWSAPFANTQPKIAIDEKIGNWQQVANPPLNYLFLGSVRYSSHLYRYYMRDNELVSLFVGYDDLQRRHRSFLSDKNAYNHVIGQVEERSLIYLETPKQHAVSVLTDTGHIRILTYHWYEGIESVAKEIARAMLALDISPFRRTRGALVIRLATDVERSPQGQMLAAARLRNFLQELTDATPKKKGPNFRFGPSLEH